MQPVTDKVRNQCFLCKGIITNIWRNPIEKIYIFAIMITEEVGDHCLLHKGMLSHVTASGQWTCG